MSALSSRRLLFVLIVLGLVFPSQASAAPWDLRSLLAKAGRFFSALWVPAGGEVDSATVHGSSVTPREAACASSSDERCDSDSERPRHTPPLGEVGCEINPNGLCGT